ncbi:MAG: FecR family protein [Pedobacter sp.]|nr:MAG: FecR family protein [Pedobacter sp.]
MTTMEKNSIKPELFERFIANESNAAELNQLFQYFEVADELELKNLIAAEIEIGAEDFDALGNQQRLDAVHAKLTEHLFEKKKSKVLTLVRTGSLLKIAASLLLISLFGLLAYRLLNPGHQITPGTTIATLSVNGKKTKLGVGHDTTIYQKNGIQVSTKADGTIVYMAVNADSATASRLNTLETPKGGEYKVTLGDGSIVMLNAGSKLTFPTDFRGTERKVFVEGEAFFKVAKNAAKPFIVAIAGSEIKVLGTQFNVSSYPEDRETTATLLEGSIQFSNAGRKVILKPNQQVSAGYSKLEVRNVSADDFAAWTKGEFLFNDVPLNVVMQKLGRWYKVEVDLAAMPQKNLYIKISRKADIDEVLENISKATGYQFEIESNKIVLEK